MKKLVSLLIGSVFLLLSSMPVQARKVGYEKFYENYAPSTVLIKMKIRVTEKEEMKNKIDASAGALVASRSGWGGCSGTFISKDGHILTAAHCVNVEDNPREKVELVEVWIKTFEGKSYKAKVLKMDVPRDLAILDIEGDDHPYLTLGKQVKPGQSIVVIASPLDLRWTISHGIVSRLNHIFKDTPCKFIQHTAMINPGSSGSALLDESGHIVGVNTRIVGFFLWNGLSFAVDLPEIEKFLRG